MPHDPLIAWLRQVWGAALARHEADRAAGRETDDVRALADRLLALLNDKATHGPDVVADMGLRAAMAAAIAAEVEALDENGR